MNNNMIQSSALLLRHVSDIIEKYNDLYKKTGLKYNIFQAAGINEKEVIMCRVLADLLNPKGIHYRGSLYLKYFWEIISPLVNTGSELNFESTAVYTEYPTDENRRIDIVLDDGHLFIPIEVKIWAGDQENQISHYAEFSRKKNREKGFVPVLYLTVEGKDPSSAKAEDFRAISFKDHILPWLKKCLIQSETEHAAPVREIIKQFIGAVKSLYGILEDEKMENAIFDLVAQSEDSAQAALAICNAFESLDNKSWDLFKGTIFEQVSKVYPKAGWDEEEGWCFFWIPLKGGKYSLSVNYDWKKMEIKIEDEKLKNTSKEARAMHQKMSELTGVTGEQWDDDGLVWMSDEDIVLHPALKSADGNLYFYALYKYYSQQTKEAAGSIIKMAQALENT